MKKYTRIIATVVMLCLISALVLPTVSTAKVSWYTMRNSSHKRPSGAWTVSKLKKYNAYYVAPTKEKVIYLTFDCGYENGNTRKIMKVLKKHGAKATFFVTKSYISTSAKICRQMKKEGHFVGNHTCSHPSIPSLSAKSLKKEINGCASYFKKKTGYKIDPFFRPPMGEFDSRSLKIVKSLGYKTIFWSMAYYDYDTSKQPSLSYVKNFFKQNYHKGAIPLIHAVSSSNAKSLDSVLRMLEKKGYRFGTLNELS